MVTTHYIDSRDGKIHSGKELFNGRTSRNHNRNMENLHKYRQQKVSKGRVSIRKQHYSIQPDDTVLYQGMQYLSNGCHCNGARVMLDNGKSVSVKQVTVTKYAGAWVSA